MKMKLLFISLLLFCCLLDHGASGLHTERVSLSEVEGESVTLDTGVETNQQDRFRWYFSDTRIAQIYGDLSKICTDVQCNEGTERFRDRLKLDNQTGSLTIMNITTNDSGLYKVQMINGVIKEFNVTVTGASGVDTDRVSVSVMEGKSVTLDTGVETAVPDLTIAAAASAVGAAVLLVAAAAVIYCCRRRSTQARQPGEMTQQQGPDQTGAAGGASSDQNENIKMNAAEEVSSDKNETRLMDSAEWASADQTETGFCPQ